MKDRVHAKGPCRKLWGADIRNNFTKWPGYSRIIYYIPYVIFIIAAQGPDRCGNSQYSRSGCFGTEYSNYIFQQNGNVNNQENAVALTPHQRSPCTSSRGCLHVGVCVALENDTYSPGALGAALGTGGGEELPCLNTFESLPSHRHQFSNRSVTHTTHTGTVISAPPPRTWYLPRRTVDVYRPQSPHRPSMRPTQRRRRSPRSERERPLPV